MSSNLTWSPTVPMAEASRIQDPGGEHDALAPATRLDEFEIIRVLGIGGFGIVYLALDHVLLRYVAIKEYMPAALAGRRLGATVHARSAGLAQPFTMGLESFFNEARLLASFDHPSLVKVHRFWKANGTAYMAMQYYPGRTLKETRLSMTASPDGTWLRALVEPLLGALDVLHRAGVYHRDISPDNILLLPDGRPVLLDFGSARRVLADRTQSLTALLKPNFAPVEQYADDAGMRQGPWTDLYALGATVHVVLTGRPPAPAVMRAVSDSLPILASTTGEAFPNIPVTFLAAIDWSLAIAPDDRPQSVVTMRRALRGEEMPPGQAPRAEAAPRSAPVEADGEAPATGLATTASRPLDPLRPTAITPSAPTPAGIRRYLSAAIAVAATGVLSLYTWSLGSWTSESAQSLHHSAMRSVATAPVTAPTPPMTFAVPLPVTPPVPMASEPVNLGHGVGISAAPRADVPASAKTSPRRQNQRVSQASPRDPRLTTEVLAPAAAHSPTPRERRTDAPVELSRPSLRGPKDMCGDRNFLSRAVCINRECQEPSFRALPECVEARRADEQRQRRMDQQ